MRCGRDRSVLRSFIHNNQLGASIWLSSSELTDPHLFRANPLPNIGWTMSEPYSLCFANRQEVRRIQIDKSDLFEIQHDPLPAPTNVSLQLLYLFRFNSTAEPENNVGSIRHFLDLQNHL